MKNKQLKEILTEKFLYKQYVVNKKSSSQIAKIVSCNPAYILKFLKKYKIKIRKAKEYVKLIIKNRRSYKGKLNPNFGKHHKFSKVTKRKMSEARKGNRNPAYTDGKCCEQYYCIDCKKKISKHSGAYGNGRCGSCASKITYKKYKQRRYNGTVKAGFYKSIYMRSSWEIKYAKYLDKKKIKWSYEPDVFDVDDTTYTPDFYLPKLKTYIEIKGWLKIKDKKKMNMFKKLYPEKSLKILREKDLIRLGVLNG